MKRGNAKSPARLKRTGLWDANEPMGVEPLAFGGQGLRAKIEGPENGTIDGREVGEPASIGTRLDMAGPLDAWRSEGVKIDGLVVDAAHLARGRNDEVH